MVFPLNSVCHLSIYYCGGKGKKYSLQETVSREIDTDFINLAPQRFPISVCNTNENCYCVLPIWSHISPLNTNAKVNKVSHDFMQQTSRKAVVPSSTLSQKETSRKLLVCFTVSQTRRIFFLKLDLFFNRVYK